MINRTNATRDEWTATLAAGDKATFYGPCDYFHVFSIANAGGISQTIKMALNKSNSFASVRAGAGLQGEVGKGDIQSVHFHNTTGAAVDVIMTYGNGQGIPGTVHVSSGSFDLSAATIAELAAALLAPIEMEPVEDTLGDAVEEDEIEYIGLKSFYCENLDDAEDVEVTWDGGSVTLAPGEFIEWSVETDTNIFIPITVTVPIGGAAKVVGTKLAA